MNVLTSTMCVAALIVAFSAAVDLPRRGAKCANVPIKFPDAPEPVFVLNGKAINRDSLSTLDPASIESIEVACAEDIYHRFGIRAQRTGMIIFTTPGPRTVLNAAMDSIATLQAAFLGRTNRFARTMDELGWSDKTGLIVVEVIIATDGASWSGVGRHRYLGTHSPVTVGGRRGR